MTRVEKVNSRIVKLEAERAMLETKAEKAREALNDWKVYYIERDIKQNERALERAKVALEDAKVKDAKDEELNSIARIPVIEEFLEKYRVAITKFHMERVEELKSWRRAPETKAMRYADRCRYVQKHFRTDTIVYAERGPEYLENDIKKDVDAKRQIFMTRIKDKTGEIYSTMLRIGMNGEINGIVRGEKGAVTVKTIGAGGWNIQKLHFRVLVKEYKL